MLIISALTHHLSKNCASTVMQNAWRISFSLGISHGMGVCTLTLTWLSNKYSFAFLPQCLWHSSKLHKLQKWILTKQYLFNKFVHFIMVFSGNRLVNSYSNFDLILYKVSVFIFFYQWANWPFLNFVMNR